MAHFASPEGWLTPLQASRRSGLSTDRIRDLADAGAIKSQRTPLGRLVDRDSLEAFVRRRGAAHPRGPAA
jgi:hypothetical protein